MVFHQKSFAFPEENVSNVMFLLLCSPTLHNQLDVAVCYGGTEEFQYRSGPYSGYIAKEPQPQTSKSKSISPDKNKKIQLQEKQKLRENCGRGRRIQLFFHTCLPQHLSMGSSALESERFTYLIDILAGIIFPSLSTIYQNLAHFSVQFQAFLRTGARHSAMLLLSCSISQIRDSQLDSVVFSSAC